jgi:ankyrin repeat protein
VYAVVKRLFVVLLILVVWMGCWMDADLNGLNEAAFSGDIEKVQSLLADGADVNGKGWDGFDTPLANAVRGGARAEVVELLLEKGADPNSEGLTGDTPLMEAEKKEIINLLRKHSGKTGEELKAEGK